MQLTNILRDIGEDWQRNRVYLPAEELARYGLGDEDIAQQRCDEIFRAMMRSQIDRARDYYRAPSRASSRCRRTARAIARG